MSDQFVSLIRTWVPIVVGSLISWLASLGLDVGAQANTGLTIFLTALVIAVYYALVRALEKKWPVVGRFLLGSSRVPEYTPPQASS